MTWHICLGDNSMDFVINKQRELKRNLADISGKLDSLHDEFAELKTSLQQNRPRKNKKMQLFVN